MIAFLTSSPFVYNAERAIINPENSFLKNLLEVLPEHPRCLVVASNPDDADGTESFADNTITALRYAGIDIEDYEILDRRNQDDVESLVYDSDLIILCGGHVPTQNAFFQEMDLHSVIADFPGVLMGISAGSMNCADVVYAQPEEEGESSPDFPRFLDGLGLTDIHILPHYQQVKDYILDGKRLFEEITFEDSVDECFLTLVDGSYVLLDDTGTFLFGEAYLIRDGAMKQISDLGDVWDWDEIDFEME